MKKLLEIVTDHKYLLGFYIFVILYILCPFQAFGNSRIQVIFQYCYIAWTFFLILYDLIKRRFRFDRMLIIMLCFFIWCCVSYVFQPKGHGLVPLKHLCTLLMFLSLIFPMSRYYSDEDLNRYIIVISKMVIYITVLLNVLSLAYYFLHNTVSFPPFITERFGIFSERNGVYRYSGIYYHPVLGGEKCFLSMILGYLLCKKEKLSKVAFGITTITGLAMIILGDSRTTYLQLLVVLAYGIYRWIDTNKGHGFSRGCLLAVVMLGIVFIVVKSLRMGLNAGTAEQILNTLSSNRLVIWRTAYQEFLKRPILGWGWENGDAIVAYTNSNIENCHNIIMNLLLWTGIPGVTLFLLMALEWIRKTIQNWRSLKHRGYDWYVIIVVALVIQSLIDILIIGEDIRLGTPLFWFFAGLVYYKSRKASA